MKTKNKIYKKIKRDLLIRDTGLDSRFTTKISKNKVKYNRKKNAKDLRNQDSEY